MDGASPPRDFSVAVGRDEDGYYMASVPSLPRSYTQALFRKPNVLRHSLRNAALSTVMTAEAATHASCF
jgi:hypothetical protein